MKEHPLQQFWTNDSGWYDSALHPLPELGMSEGRLAIDTWNAAVKAALNCVVVDGNPEVARKRIESLFYSGATS